jgi:hypothetical protein
MSYTDENGPVLAADGQPLKRSLAIALRRQKNPGAALDLSAAYICIVYVPFSHCLHAVSLSRK